MVRKIPARSGSAVSNAERLDRSVNFADSAARYMAAGQGHPSGQPGGNASDQLTDGGAGGEEKETRKEGKGQPRREPRPMREKPAAGPGLEETEPYDAPEEARSVTYYPRLLPDGQTRLDALARMTGMRAAYMRKALARNLRERLMQLRDTGTWANLAGDIQRYLEDAKGAGEPFPRGMIRLTSEQQAAVRQSVDDPLGIFGTSQILSAYAKAILALEITRLAEQLGRPDTSETISTDRETPEEDRGRA